MWQKHMPRQLFAIAMSECVLRPARITTRKMTWNGVMAMCFRETHAAAAAAAAAALLRGPEPPGTPGHLVTWS